ncbi:uncharacterized protein LOC112564515 [Pomacea canaliculata]|uniref:uncharacterized protein LOC112564515 n=1 Tax=Pomacea canaliculata TaxID=400727 RepID=UPI000D73094F|nr:uncharacterized protein LOC112564515 [Pomacea canaliculata]
MPKIPVMSSSTSSSSSTSTTAEKTEPRPKVDPSFKSKRYRDKLRTEVKALEGLLPVDRTSLSRKLDSQTVFRLVIAFLRTQGYFQALGFQNGQTEAADDAVDDYQENAQDVQGINELVNGFSCLQVRHTNDITIISHR